VGVTGVPSLGFPPVAMIEYVVASGMSYADVQEFRESFLYFVLFESSFRYAIDRSDPSTG
jgi:hypothetical protein